MKKMMFLTGLLLTMSVALSAADPVARVALAEPALAEAVGSGVCGFFSGFSSGLGFTALVSGFVPGAQLFAFVAGVTAGSVKLGIAIFC